LNTYLIQGIKAAIKAGTAILEIYNKDFEVDFKEDDSPLTEADRSADRVIKGELGDSFPILSEEGKMIPYSERRHWHTFWLVDPLDGTKEFVKKNDEFTVNIALIQDGIPVLGVVYVPVFGQLYFASESCRSSVAMVNSSDDFCNAQALINKSTRLNTDSLPSVFTVVASRSHRSSETEAFISECKREHGELDLISKGSSLKLCLVAEGKAHIYPRLAPTMEWDTAAAHAIARFAGCEVLDFNTREELTYNKENLLNPHFLVTR
jgi:3'(2'), 5'-bisphosphate nucleotidase